MGSAEEGHGSNPYMQMQLMEQQVWTPSFWLRNLPAYHVVQDNYIQTRSTAIESIESTIAELGQIFSQLATMVAEQRETVQRIDADTMDIAENVSGAHRELLKYWDRVSSNRTLMLQVFGVLILFVSSILLSLGGRGLNFLCSSSYLFLYHDHHLIEMRCWTFV